MSTIDALDRAVERDSADLARRLDNLPAASIAAHVEQRLVGALLEELDEARDPAALWSAWIEWRDSLDEDQQERAA